MPSTSSGASSRSTKAGTFVTSTLSQRPPRHCARTSTTPPGASRRSIVSGSVIATMPVSSRTVAVQIVFEPDIGGYSVGSMMMNPASQSGRVGGTTRLAWQATLPRGSRRSRRRSPSPSRRSACEAAIGGDRERWLRWTALSYEQLDDLRQPPYGERAIVLNDSGVLVGLVGLVPSLGPFGLLPSWPEPGDRFLPEVGLYWAVAPEHRRRGFAAEAAAILIDHAFAELDLARVVATTERENAASIGVMRRLGMRVEENPEPEPAWFQVVGILSHDRQG